MLSSVIITDWGKGKLYVEVPQSSIFSFKIRGFGPEPINELWAPSGRAWIVSSRYEAELRRIATAVFGTDQPRYEPVTVQFQAYPIWISDLQGTRNILSFAGRDAITRPRNHVPVRPEAGVTILGGEFPPTGGTIGCPALGITPESNITIEMVDVPAHHPAIQSGIGIISMEEQNDDEKNARDYWTSSMVDDSFCPIEQH